MSTHLQPPITVGACLAFTAAELAEAREWLAGCQWADMDAEDFADVSDERVILGVARFYSGGVEAFLRDNLFTS